MENFKWWHIPILIIVWLVGLWFNEFIRKRKK
jgi:hypothetical protein